MRYSENYPESINQYSDDLESYLKQKYAVVGISHLISDDVYFDIVSQSILNDLSPDESAEWLLSVIASQGGIN